MDNVTRLADAKFKAKRGRKAAPGSMPHDVWDRLDYGRDGPKVSLHNLVLVLNEHPEWRGVFGFDKFEQTVKKLKPPPCGGEPGEFTKVDAMEVATWMSNPAQAGINCTDDLAKKAVLVVAYRQAFHVVRDYLDGLAWDGSPRLERLFSDHCGADHNPYSACLGPMLLVSAVARVREPGCRVNFMLILEGEQQISKSDFVRQLFGPQWSCEANESPAHKDFYQTLIGQWGIEICEMHSFSRADVNRVKQAVTQPVDVYRKSYDDKARRYPRQCVFVGTTNENEYLTDPSGAARFLPVRVTGVEIEALKRERDQLWAEAAALYAQGFRFWELPPEARQEQELRYRVDSWEEPIVEWLTGEAADVKYPTHITGAIERVTITDLMLYALGVDIAKHTRQDQMRVGAILRRLNWERQRARGDGERSYVYRRPAQDGVP